MILLLSNNENVKQLKDKLDRNYEVVLYHDKLTPEYIKELDPEIVISYNYSHIVKEDVIDLLGDRIINLHCSLLPWNKGASPNIWSFIEDTPKGVTIHILEKGLDTGRLLLQEEVSFDEDKETLASSYNKLQETIVDLLVSNFDDILAGNIVPVEQKGEGSYHRTSDLIALLNGKEIDYNMTIKQFRDFIRSSSGT
ncbi:MAG: formyl transferase [Lachnospiraceae bacterium]|nr:formyl transferase [Lachnospiraceae bacterium]